MRKEETSLGRLHPAAKVPAKPGPHPWIGAAGRRRSGRAKVPFLPQTSRTWSQLPGSTQNGHSVNPHLSRYGSRCAPEPQFAAWLPPKSAALLSRRGSQGHGCIPGSRRGRAAASCALSHGLACMPQSPVPSDHQVGIFRSHEPETRPTPCRCTVPCYSASSLAHHRAAAATTHTNDTDDDGVTWTSSPAGSDAPSEPVTTPRPRSRKGTADPAGRRRRMPRSYHRIRAWVRHSVELPGEPYGIPPRNKQLDAVRGNITASYNTPSMHMSSGCSSGCSSRCSSRCSSLQGPLQDGR